MEIFAAFIIGLASGSIGMYFLAYREMRKIREQNKLILEQMAVQNAEQRARKNEGQ